METIGDAYMIVSGIPKENDKRHGDELASVAMSMMDVHTHTPSHIQSK